MKLNKEKIKELSKKSIIEKIIEESAAMREKEIKIHKEKSIKYSLFIGLFFWLFLGLLIKNILLSASIAIIFTIFLFIFILQLPILKRVQHTKKVEADLPILVLKMVYEIKAGKSFFKTLEDCSKEKEESAKEIAIVVEDMKKGATINEALERMNKRLCSTNIKRVSSNLANIYSHGTKDISGLKKLAQELLLKQRIESKEFSSKMIVYSLIFITLSAIAPAMFQSFILVGSYFMKIEFTPIQVLIIIIALFPLIDIAVLSMINSKTPLFLKSR
jgi:archaeal flagellar protein FlaJ